MPEKYIEHENTENIICPYCGYEDRDSWDYDSNSSEVDCGSCEKEFHYERIIDITYSTQKIGE